jgi:hypothetical protein
MAGDFTGTASSYAAMASPTFPSVETPGARQQAAGFQRHRLRFARLPNLAGWRLETLQSTARRVAQLVKLAHRSWNRAVAPGIATSSPLSPDP